MSYKTEAWARTEDGRARMARVCNEYEALIDGALAKAHEQGLSEAVILLEFPKRALRVGTDRTTALPSCVRGQKRVMARVVHPGQKGVLPALAEASVDELRKWIAVTRKEIARLAGGNTTAKVDSDAQDPV